MPPIAAAVGPSGRVVGIDISADQIAAARRRCADRPNIETVVLDVRRLPYEPGSVDAVVATQVIEYIEDPGQALRELRRVVTDRGRAVIAATNWDAVLWGTGSDELTKKVQLGWRRHAPHPNLPADLRPLLRQAGFRVVRQTPFAVLGTAFHEDSFGYWLARLMVAFCVSRSLVSEGEGEAWLASLAEAHQHDRFFLSVTPILTVAVAE